MDIPQIKMYFGEFLKYFKFKENFQIYCSKKFVFCCLSKLWWIPRIELLLVFLGLTTHLLRRVTLALLLDDRICKKFGIWWIANPISIEVFEGLNMSGFYQISWNCGIELSGTADGFLERFPMYKLFSSNESSTFHHSIHFSKSFLFIRNGFKYKCEIESCL